MSDRSVSLGLTVALVAAGLLAASAAARAEEQLIAVFPPQQQQAAPVYVTQQAVPQQVIYTSPAAMQSYASIQPEDEMADEPAEPRLKRQIVDYNTQEPAGTVIVDTPNTFLYLVLGNGKALRYGIGVGREGFTWSGVKQVARKAEWPDWYPPAEMVARQPYLPRMTAGGPGNPLGARAIYIGGTEYRIHGTNAPQTIGKQVSSGCIRLTNEDVIDLYSRVQVGAKVVVLPQVAHAARPAERVSSYAPQTVSRAQATWNGIRPNGLY